MTAHVNKNKLLTSNNDLRTSKVFIVGEVNHVVTK